jgi:two-component system, NtrC family, sensor histidine kinase HydH
MHLPLARRRVLLYPLIGMVCFILLSFAHDGFRGDRSMDTFFLPIGVGLTIGTVIGLLQNRMEIKTRTYERQLSKEREDAALGRAAATIAHEVRNPLNALGMGLQRLQMEARELAPEHLRVISLMLDSVRRANGIVSGLLDYAKPQKPVMKPMRLDLVVDDILSAYLPSCGERGINVTWSVKCHEPIQGDRDLIGQVVENLLRNAVEAQPAGGFIDIAVKREARAIALTVRNQGFSLATDEVERIFEPYFTTKAQGTGLGLAISRRIAEAHGAEILPQVSGLGILEVALCFPEPRLLSEPHLPTEVSSAP